jgi:hypothetical protein
LLDNKTDVSAYLWKENPFTEIPMTKIGDKLFSYTLTGQTIGSTISYACKFAFAGGMAVTKYISYVVGDNCINVGIENIFESPLSLFPNPVENELTIRGISESATIFIYDLNGQQLLEKTAISETEKMDVSHMNKGIYLI